MREKVRPEPKAKAKGKGRGRGKGAGRGGAAAGGAGGGGGGGPAGPLPDGVLEQHQLRGLCPNGGHIWRSSYSHAWMCHLP
eukprot:9491139-Pyramimonas_sp.AAC.1